VQIGVLVAAGLLARRVTRLIEQIERETAPILASLNAIGQDAARAAALATAQVERVDRLLADAAQRAESMMGAIQTAMTAPAREGAALMAGLRAMVDSIRRSMVNRPSRTRSVEEEDALFI
jgi:NADPH-dependent ferric siderophore reductase